MVMALTVRGPGHTVREASLSHAQDKQGASSRTYRQPGCLAKSEHTHMAYAHMAYARAGVHGMRPNGT